MPPRKRVSAPVNRVYKSATPLKQAKLPAPKKLIKSYGKKSGVRVPKQETLTQMDFVKMHQAQHDDEKEEDEDEDEDQDYEEESKKRKKKRRKATGDEPSTTPQFHTQTITQLDWSFNSIPEGEDRSILDDPSFSQSAKLPKYVRKRPGEAESSIPPPPQRPLIRDTPPPQMPDCKLTREIPSSQSPTTPLSLHSRGSGSRRSPLTDISINAAIPFNTNSKSQGIPSKIPKLEVEETSDGENHPSQLNPIPSTPSKRSSPAKIVRFVLPELEEKDETATSFIKSESTSYPASQTLTGNSSRNEILDSDAESEYEEHEEPPASASQVEEEGNPGQEIEEDKELLEGALQEVEDQQAETESCYGEIGAETQMEAERILDSPRLSEITPTTQARGNPAAKTSQERTQMMESQRLATQYMNAMAPRTANSDIFISIHPQHVTNIVNRAKDHEMRSWSIPPTVCRIWIYETKPVSALKYMAEIGPAKRPGQISDVRGLGNAEFNTRKGSHWTAYEILQLYELSDPLPLSQLIVNEWLKSAPQRFAWVRPAVLDQLIANLKPPLFHAAEAQLLSTIKQFTQPALPSQHSSSQLIKYESENHEPAPSSYATPRTNIKMAPPASQATTVDLSQTQTPRHHSLDEVVWESPTRPIPSSTPLKLPTLSASSEYPGLDSLVPYSMASSQLLTKSQLLSESLLNESVPGPPLFIQDSDDEEEL
jgi:hypothetical protein